MSAPHSLKSRLTKLFYKSALQIISLWRLSTSCVGSTVLNTVRGIEQ